MTIGRFPKSKLSWPKPNVDTGGEFIKPRFCVGKDDVKSRYLRPSNQFATSINVAKLRQIAKVQLQDLGFLVFTLPEVEILMPTKKPRGEELTREQQWTNQALHQRRLRIEHVNSSVKRCRIVKDRIRLWKEGVRDLVMELCCALHNFRVRLTPWQPMV